MNENKLQMALIKALCTVRGEGHSRREFHWHGTEVQLAELLATFPDVAALRTEGIAIKAAAMAVANDPSAANVAALKKELGL